MEMGEGDIFNTETLTMTDIADNRLNMPSTVVRCLSPFEIGIHISWETSV